MDINSVLYMLAIVIGAYIIGSIPTGYIFVKVLKGEDVRTYGSGSTGATNVKRVLGSWAFYTVSILDCIKGALPVVATHYLDVKFNLMPAYGILPVLSSIAVILGHSKSIFLGFTGGKSVASGVGTIFGLYWPVGLITIIIWSGITYVSKYVSLSSMIAVMLTALWMYLFKQPVAYVIYCLIGGLYIVYLHKDNIKRLVAGTENKVR